MNPPTWPSFAPRFAERAAVVTGASSGNGRAIALRLAREGAALVCVDLRPTPLEGGFDADAETDTDALIRANGGQAIFVRADITSESDLSNVGQAAVDQLGSLDVWVNNAGISYGNSSILQEPTDRFRRTLEVNLTGTWNGAREAVRRMKDQDVRGRSRGRIINIGSIAGSIGQADLSSYSASKGGVHNLTQALAIELAPVLINVNTVAPGYLPTAMNRVLWEDEEEMAHVRRMHPLPLGVPDDIAAAVAFLASDDAAFITGATLPVDGGMAAK